MTLEDEEILKRILDFEIVFANGLKLLYESSML